ncbi:hypothetical protein ILYODFUR_016603 [Ilyodon furcidens]|uniref:Uncharacterized protein n=1 Tax=Ilyodon furcidens TaxID=33524 RepID=A0ABV0TJ73_9TELE
MALDLEGLILIPAASQSAANCPSACFRSWLEGAGRTTSSAKIRDKIHHSPNQSPSGPCPTVHHEGQKQMPSPGPQNTCGLVGQTSLNPLVPYRGCRVGPVFHGRVENHTVPPEAEVRLSDGLSFSIPWHRPYPGG